MGLGGLGAAGSMQMRVRQIVWCVLGCGNQKCFVQVQTAWATGDLGSLAGQQACAGSGEGAAWLLARPPAAPSHCCAIGEWGGATRPGQARRERASRSVTADNYIVPTSWAVSFPRRPLGDLKQVKPQVALAVGRHLKRARDIALDGGRIGRVSAVGEVG